MRHAPDRYGEWVYVTNSPTEPGTVREVKASPDKAKWETTMENEMKSLKDHDVWDLVDLPEGKRIVGSKWVFKVKMAADGSVERHKARLVAQGFTQRAGQDYDQTFSSVVRSESVRTLIAVALARHHDAPPDGCYNGFPEREARRSNLHETT